MWQAEYLPFGKVNISVAQIENNLRFPGQYYDAETGLHYNWNRYYNSETGRQIKGKRGQSRIKDNFTLTSFSLYLPAWQSQNL